MEEIPTKCVWHILSSHIQFVEGMYVENYSIFIHIEPCVYLFSGGGLIISSLNCYSIVTESGPLDLRLELLLLELEFWFGLGYLIKVELL